MFVNTELHHQVTAADVLKTTFAYLLLWALVKSVPSTAVSLSSLVVSAYAQQRAHMRSRKRICAVQNPKFQKKRIFLKFFKLKFFKKQFLKSFYLIVIIKPWF